MLGGRSRIETLSRHERKERELISSMKVEASSKDTWSSGYELPAPICRASGTLRSAENYIAFSSFDTPRNIFRRVTVINPWIVSFCVSIAFYSRRHRFSNRRLFCSHADVYWQTYVFISGTILEITFKYYKLSYVYIHTIGEGKLCELDHYTKTYLLFKDGYYIIR